MWAAWPVVALPLAVVAVLVTRPPEARVGADGVSIRKRRVTRFFPLHRIVAIRGDAYQLRIELDDRKTLVIPGSPSKRAFPWW